MNQLEQLIIDEISPFNLRYVATFNRTELFSFMVFRDDLHDMQYIVIIKERADTNSAEPWEELFDLEFKKVLDSNKIGSLAVLFVLPIAEKNIAINLLKAKGIAPVSLDMFSGYAALGFKSAQLYKLSTYYYNITASNIDEESQNVSDKKDEYVADSAADDEYIVGEYPPDYPVYAPNAVEAPLFASNTNTKPRSKKGLLLIIPFMLILLGIGYAISTIDADEAPAVDNVTEGYVEFDSELINGVAGNKEIISAVAPAVQLYPNEINYMIVNGMKYAVAQNPYIPSGTLAEYAKDMDTQVRVGVASNTALPNSIAEQLSRDVAPNVRTAINSNPSVSSDILTRLSADRDENVRMGIVSNPNAPTELLTAITDDVSNAECKEKEAYYANPQLSREIINSGLGNDDPCVKRGLASNINIPSQELYKLARDGNPSVRAAAMTNSKLTPDVLNRLNERYFPDGWSDSEQSEDITARQALLSNPNQAPQTLDNYKDNPALYSSAVANNPATTDEQKAELFSLFRPRGGVEGLISDMETLPNNSSNEDIRSAFENNIYNPLELLYAKIKGDSAKEAEYETFVQRIGAGELTLAAMPAGGEFLAPNSSRYQLESIGKDSYSELLSYIDNDMAIRPIAETIFENTDDIVDKAASDIRAGDTLVTAEYRRMIEAALEGN